MARRNQSPVEDVIEVTSKLHWSLGVSLAVVSYLFLHWYSLQEVPVATGVDSLSSSIVSIFLRGMATFGQFILPFIFSLGALISVFNRRKRKKLYEDTRESTAANPLEKMSWSDFELMVGEHFRQQGFNVQETAGGADGGIDLVLVKEGAEYFVQCKQWKAYKVGVKIIRELLGVMVGGGAAGGYVVTSGIFTKDAVRFAQDNNIELIDGDELKRIISSGVQPKISVQPSTKPLCPKCGSKMVKRVAKKGARAGQQFWGCSKFPSCRGTIAYRG